VTATRIVRAASFILAFLASSPVARCAADVGRPFSLSAPPDREQSVSAAGWSFFSPCEGIDGAPWADDSKPCGPITLLGPTDRSIAVGAPQESEDGASSAAPVDPANIAKPQTRPDHFLGALIAGLAAGTGASSFGNGDHQSYHFTNELWFGRSTYAGGADKAAHFALSNIASRELANLYAKLGYSDAQSRLLGFGATWLAGLVMEIGDGTTKYGFSYEDLLADLFGAGAAALTATFGVDDLVGFRWGFLVPPEEGTCCPVKGLGGDYSSYVYTADLKLAGAGRRLGLDIGPLRYVLLSVTYGTKGYPSGIPEKRQRRVGVELGLNLSEILSDLGANRTTWWGYLLHVVGDNIRFPYTAGGFRYDLNHGEWHGPTTR
jgi:predicted lipoprotein DUF2279